MSFIPLAQTGTIEIFEKAAALAFFKIPWCWMTTTRKHFAYKQNITSFAVKIQLTPSQWKLLNSRVLALGKQLPNVRSLNLLRVNDVWLVCQTNALGTTWKCRNIFAAHWQNWPLISCWNTQVYFVRSWQLPSNLIYTKLMQILRMLLDRPFKKSATRKVTLKRSFFVWLHHVSRTFATYGQNRPEQYV